MKTVFSVIIPIFNGNPCLLERAINSIPSKNYKIEAIIVDDGSQAEYANAYDKIVGKYEFTNIVHQTNKGVSAARNTGINISLGEFVLFLDADDFYEANIFDEVYQCILSEPDLICFGFNKIKNERNLKKIDYKINDFGFNKCIFKSLACNVDSGYSLCWNKVYKKKFLEVNKLYFCEKLSYAEDAEFVLRVVDKAESVLYIQKPLYNYCVNPLSVSQVYNPNLLNGYIDSMNYILKLSSYNIEDRSHIIMDHLLFSVVKCFFKKDVLWKEEKRRLLSLLNVDCYKFAMKNFNLSDFSFKKRLMILMLKYKLFRLLKFCVIKIGS